MGARRGGGQEGALAPPSPGNSKIWGPPKDNLTRKIKKKIFKKLSEETELRAPHLVSEETDQWGPPIVSKETDLRGPPI